MTQNEATGFPSPCPRSAPDVESPLPLRMDLPRSRIDMSRPSQPSAPSRPEQRPHRHSRASHLLPRRRGLPMRPGARCPEASFPVGSPRGGACLVPHWPHRSPDSRPRENLRNPEATIAIRTIVDGQDVPDSGTRRAVLAGLPGSIWRSP